MKTFDFEQVDSVLAPLKAKFEDCAHGEGNACETLDKHLDCCATICFEVVAKLREWANGVFSGDVIFDPAAENNWRGELAQIYSRATRIWHTGRTAEVPCWELPGQHKLSSALWEMHRLLEDWVSPQPSFGPMARTKMKFSTETSTVMQQQLRSLPPLSMANKK